MIALVMPWEGRAAVSNVPGFDSFEVQPVTGTRRAVEFVNGTIFVVSNVSGAACNETVYRVVNGTGVAIASGFGAITGMVYDAVGNRLLLTEATQSCGGPGNTILQIPSPFTTPSTVPSNTTVPSPFSIPGTPTGMIPGLADITMDLTNTAGQRVLVTQENGSLHRIYRVTLGSQTLAMLQNISGGTITGVTATATQVYFGKVTSGGSPVGQIFKFAITATSAGAATQLGGNRPGSFDLDLEADGTIVSSEFSATSGASRVARIHPTTGAVIGIAGAGIGAPTEIATNSADGSCVVVDFDATPSLVVLKPTECNDGKDNNGNGQVDLDFCATRSTPTENLAHEIASDHQYAVEGSPTSYSLRRYSLKDGASIGNQLLTRFVSPPPPAGFPDYQMTHVTDVAVDRQGLILVADAGEEPGTTVGGFPTGRDGAVYLVDPRDGGALIVSDTYFNPMAVALDSDGSFLVYDGGGFDLFQSVVELCRYQLATPPTLDCFTSITPQFAGPFAHFYSNPSPARVAASPTTGKVYLLSDVTAGVNARVNRFTSALDLDSATPIYQQATGGPGIFDLEVTRAGRVLIVECSGSGVSEVCNLRELETGPPSGTLVKSNIGGRDVEELTNGNLRIRRQSGFYSELNLTTLAITTTSIPAAGNAVAAAVQIAQCADKVDNDAVGGVDHPGDAACASATDELEATLAGGLDADGVPDYLDNCSLTANGQVATPTSFQLDADLDGFGNACDADYDQSNTTTAIDFSIFLGCFGASTPLTGECPETDADGNGFVSATDFAVVTRYFGVAPPGPSTLKCANATATGSVCP